MYSQIFASPPSTSNKTGTGSSAATATISPANRASRPHYQQQQPRRYAQPDLFNQPIPPIPPKTQSFLSPVSGPAPPQQQQQQHKQETPVKRGVEIPSQAASVNDRKGSFVYETYQPDERPTVLPPPPSTQLGVQVIDCGNCSPQVIRMSTYAVPVTREMNDAVGLPLGAVVAPLGAPVAAEATVSASDKGPYYSPARCGRCGAYVNAHTKFVRDGMFMRCGLCNAETEVPEWYFSPLDVDGVRADAGARPELCFGTVEYDVTDVSIYSQDQDCSSKQINCNAPSDELTVFVIDISSRALLSGMTSIAASTLRQAIAQKLNGNGSENGDNYAIPPNTRVAFVTYNKVVHFWEVGGVGRKRPSLRTVLDTRTPFVPKGNFFVPASEARCVGAPADFLLTNLAQLGEAQPEFCRTGDSALAAALSGALGLAKAAGRTGKIVLFHATTPASEPGRIVLRDSVSYYGTEFEPSLFMAYSPFYESFGAECAAADIGVDAFVFSATYADVASVGRVCHSTGGQVHYFHRFDVARDAWKVEAEVLRTFTRPRGSAAVLRVRLSAGLSVVRYSGCGQPLPSEPDTLRLAAVDADKAVGVLFKYDDRTLPDDEDVTVQSALLYTDSISGRRLLRVNTLRVPVSICTQGVFSAADGDTIFALTARSAAESVLAGDTLPGDIFTGIETALVRTLAEYRTSAASSSQATRGQLVLPEPLALLPLSVLALCKTPLLRREIKPDLRCAAAFQVLAEAPAVTALRFHPRIYSLEHADQGGDVAAGALRLAAHALSQDGVYFVDDGVRPMVWVGKNPSQETLRDLFGDAAGSRKCAVLTQKLLSVLQASADPSGDGDGAENSAGTPNEVLRGLVRDAAQLRGHTNFSITVGNEEEGAYPSIWQILVEDSQGQAAPSYADFLRSLHTAILRKLGYGL